MKKYFIVLLSVLCLCTFNAYAEEIQNDIEILSEDMQIESTEVMGEEAVYADDTEVGLISEDKFTASIPSDGETGVKPNSDITLQFDGQIDSNELSNAIFKLNGSTEYIEASGVNEDGDLEVQIAALDSGTKYIFEFENVICDGVAVNGKISFITGFASMTVVHSYEGDTIADYYERHLGATSVSTDNNLITIEADKSCSIYSSEQSIDPSEVNMISFTISSDTSFKAALYWSDRKLSGFADTKKYEFNVSAGTDKTYILPLSSYDEWNNMGVVKGLRLYQLDDKVNTFSISKISYLNGIPDEDFQTEIKIGKFSLKTPDDEDITNGVLTSGTINAIVDAIYNDSEEEKKVLLLAASYNDDAMESIQCKWIKLQPKETLYNQEVSIDVSDGGSVKAFIRSGLTDITSLKSYISAE